MKKLLLFLFLAPLLVGCSNKSIISTGSVLYKVSDNTTISMLDDKLTKNTLTDPYKAVIEEKTDYVVITTGKSKKGKDPDPVFSTPEEKGSGELVKSGFRADITTKYYFPETVFDPDHLDIDLKYFNTKFGIQALTVPFKFRGKFSSDSTTYYPQVETGFNVSFAPGVKFNWNTYKPDKDIWGNHVRTLSVTVGGLIGGSAADLNAKNAPGLVGERKAALYSLGVYAMIGYSKVSIGYAFGADRVLGKGKDYWVYQKKGWHGLIIALDIAKF